MFYEDINIIKRKTITNGAKYDFFIYDMLSLEKKHSNGKFGRVLGDVVVDDVNINQSMIENHHAVAYFGQSKDDIEAGHLENREKLIQLGVFIPNE